MSGGSENRFRLLIVGYHFMKTQEAGGHRLFAIAKYLSRMMWDLTVLTAGRDVAESGESDDEAVYRYIPAETRVIRTGSISLEWLWNSLRSAKVTARSSSSAGTAANRGRRPTNIGRRLLGFWKVPARWARGILSFPDSKIGWFFPLLLHGWKLLRGNRFDVVLTSGPPQSCHLPFVLLRRCFRFVWVCDFRDPWTAPPLYAADPRSLSTKRLSLFLNRGLERCVLRTCDRILANTAGNGEALQRTFGKLIQHKLTVLTNGFDAEISASRGRLDESSVTCDFVFTGAMYPWMLNVYLGGLTHLRDSHRPLPKLHLFGAPLDEVVNKVHDSGFDEDVVFMGSVSFEESLWVQRHAKALLLPFVAHNDVFKHSVPSKLYAYLSSRRPYLALVPDGDAARILEEVGGGVIIKSTEPREVANGITSFLRSLETRALRCEHDEEALARYSWSNLASRLGDVLREDVQQTGQGRR